MSYPAEKNQIFESAIAACLNHSTLNALIGFDESATRARYESENTSAQSAQSAPSPFTGIPFVVKDNIAVAHLPLTGGCPAFASYIPNESASCIQRITHAGGFMLAKANLHELAFGITSNNAAFGPVRNPYDQSRLAGGSSGGCAVAVATGMSPFAIGNDTGGSIRIPAALCGVFGFRPTVKRYPTDGVMTLSPTRDAIGTMANTIFWLRELDTLLTQADTTNQLFDSTQPCLAVPRDPFWKDLSHEMRTACEMALQKLQQSGVRLVEVDGRVLHEIDAEIGFPIAVYETWQEWKESVPKRLGMTVEAMTPLIASPDVRGLFEMMASTDAPTQLMYASAITKRATLQYAYQSLLQNNGAQALIMPTTVRAAMSLEEADECSHNGSMRPTFPTYVRQTSPASVAGCPSISIPAGNLASGLPFGLMLDALPHCDRALMGLAEQLHKILN